jgi:hypothetical protein
MLLILLIILIVVMFAGIPSFPVGYNRQGNYGYYPSAVGLILIIVLILFLMRII